MALLDFLPIIGDIIDAGAGHYENNRQMHFQRDMMHEQMAWQEKMNAQQQEWQEGMWNKTNEYNTPNAQLNRLMAAGINPNNAGMQVAGGSNNASMAQQPEIPGAPGGLPGSSPGPTHFGQGFEASALLDAQRKNIEANTEKIKEETRGQGIINERGEMENSVWMTNWNVDLAMKKSNIDLTKQQKDNLQFQFDILFPQEEEMNEKQIDLLCGTAKKLAQEVANLKKEEKKIDEEIKTEQQKQGVLASEQAVNYAQAENIKANTEGTQSENVIKNMIAKVAKETGVDITKLSAMEQINLQLAKAGYNESEIEGFWEATRGDLSSQFQNTLKRWFVDGGAGTAIGAGIGAAVGAKGVKGMVKKPKKVKGFSSNGKGTNSNYTPVTGFSSPSTTANPYFPYE